jgi:signal transduction histidine kinase
MDMRMLIFDLHPPVLKEAGLAAALQTRLAAVESRAGLQTRLHVQGEGRLPLALEEELFWIALEAFNNVVKHAQAGQVTVHLRWDEQQVCLRITDDGVGFDLAPALEGGGMGLRGIGERVARISGELVINTSPGHGTSLRVEAEVPLQRDFEILDDNSVSQIP